MRHVYIRGILAVVWFGAAIVCGMSGRFEMAALYGLMGGAFLYFAYAAWKKDKGGR